MNFSTVSPWGDLARCVLNTDGSVAYFLDKDNSNLKADGTEVNWSEVESSGQNVMVQIPKFYYAKKGSAEDFDFGVSAKPIQTNVLEVNDWKIHPAFFRDRTKLCDDQTAVPEEVDFRYFGAFKGWVDAQGRLRSLPNKLPTASETIGAFRTHAKNMGVGYSQLDYYLLYAIQMLYITEYSHPDSQTMIGRGYADENSSAIITGGTIQYGNNTFGETTGKKQMSYRGIEDLWGNVRHWVDGMFCNASRDILIGNKGYNNTGVGYENLELGGSSANPPSGNVRDIQDNSKAGFIIKSGGLTYDTGGLYDEGFLASDYLPVAGGYWKDASTAGAFYFRVTYSASASQAYIGSLLSL